MISLRQFLGGLRAIVLLLLLVGFAPAATPNEPLAIVVAASSPLRGLSFHELKRLFMGRRMKDASGKWLLPLNRKKKAADRIAFDQRVLGMTPAATGSYWVDRKIRGQSGAPKSFKSAAVIVRLVAKVPGAIGYVRKGDVRAGLRVIKIDGKLPGQPGYALTTK